jgi:hypothetical protein
MVTTLAIIILWAMFSIMTAMEYAPYSKNLSFSKRVILIIICLMGPVFVANNILAAILDMILPEGWDDDDDFKGL